MVLVKVNHTVNLFGSIGCFLFLLLSMPFIRSALFGDNAKILDMFDPDSVAGAGPLQQVMKYVLLVPYYINESIFRNFDFGNFNLLVFFIFTPVVYRYFSFSKNYKEFLVLFFLFFPAPLLFLSTFTKDVLLCFALFLSFGYTKSLERKWKPVFFFVYATFLRPYLFWVYFSLRAKNLKYALFIVLVFLLLIFNVDFLSEAFFKVLNRRMVESSYVANSAINQTIIVEGVDTIFLMLLEVVPQFLLPIVYDFNLKTLILQSYILFYLCVFIIYRNKYSNTLLGLFFMYIILDPDLGAFFRHLASFFVLFPLAIYYKRVNND